MATGGLLVACGLIVVLGFGGFAVASAREGEKRAARIALILAVAVALLFFLAALMPASGRAAALCTAAAAVTVGLALFLLPGGRAALPDAPTGRYDERDIMFARARLVPGTAEYEVYYALHPAKQARDDKTRTLPGLLAPESREANPPVYAAIGATFDWIEHVRDRVDGQVAAEAIRAEPAAVTEYVKALARYWGARVVGVTDLRPYHVYSHIGRGSGEYGAPVHLDHRYAVAFAVEMARAAVASAPAAPTLLESARQYARAAEIAVLLASTIRAMGYPARAHIDGNYRVIAPLVAWDAGLGEFGRMGLLMTPELGPRVRLGVVTTDLPLVVDGRAPDATVIDFCTVCRKCADNCPVHAIPGGERQRSDGALRWQINQEKCYRYWCIAGTDCARCVAVCPYSHPDALHHNLVRRAVRRSGLARRAVVHLDRVFYGARPHPHPAPAWLPPKPDQPAAGFSISRSGGDNDLE